ncbi:YkvA family protein [Exiguobacterium mexicanum]|uniref:YkvA family protein n=1 Tax=Exiguobacterium mexicanum TaxID=340146 RepID=UPI00110D9FB1|nr:YkvA family protein [Exiguobacterium mexicanum]
MSDWKTTYTHFLTSATEDYTDNETLGDLLVQGELALAKVTVDVASNDISNIEREEELTLYFQMKQLLNMLRAVYNHQFEMQPDKQHALVAAVLYFVSPFDAIPDDAPLGLFDDAQVIDYVHEQLASDIDRFHNEL